MDYDAIVIGGGPAGYASAIRLAQRGKRVLLAEREKIGGECLNYGCIPSKALIEMANSAHYLTEIPGVKSETAVDMKEWVRWKWSMIEKLTGGVTTLLRAWKVDVVSGSGKITGERKVSVDGKDYTADNIIIATGSRPVEIPGFEGVSYNREILDLDHIPESIVVIGGGYIGVELGTAYAKLGSHVTIVEMMDKVLPGVDHALTRFVEKTLSNLGVDVITGNRVDSVSISGGKREVVVGDRKITAETVFLTVGRRPNTEGIGLESAGIEMDGPFIKTGSTKMTNIQGIYAVGDVSGQPMLAHKAFYDADVVAENIAGNGAEADYRAIPYVIYSDPELSYVGDLSGKASTYPLGANGRALGMNTSNGSYRIFSDEDGFVTGAALAAPHSSEMISEISLAIIYGLTVNDIGATVHPHPTISEGVMEAAQGGYSKPLHFKPLH